MKLTERQKKFLRREAHPLKPAVSLGDKGLSAAAMQELDSTLEHHELIKVKIRAGDRETRDAMVKEITKNCSAILISRVGNIAALYRPRKRDPKIVLPKAG